MTNYSIALMSSVPGLVTSARALIEIAPAPPEGASVRLNGLDHEVRPVSHGDSWRLVLHPLNVGENSVELNAADGIASLAFRATAPNGPVFSGPRPSPWTTKTVEAGLGEPVDDHGSAPAVVRYVYMSRRSGRFEPYHVDDAAVIDDVADVTTDAGVSMPYVVRHEIGTAGLGIYELAVLSDPTRDWTGANPQPSWNGKLWIYLYGGWNQHWSQSTLSGEAPPPAVSHTVLIDSGLRRGYMVARTTQSQSATNSDSVRGAESLVQLKDHILANYGHIRFTVASGASGGSIMQHMVANQYPGIFQGIMPLSSLHGSWYVSSVVAESKLLEHYFTETSPELWRTEAERAAVDGHRGDVVRKFFYDVFDHEEPRVVGGNDPHLGTMLPEEYRYGPENPRGVRGGLADYQVNYLGRRSESVWTDAERAAGHGFAHRPWDNTGVQYGLAALLNGQISVEQFLDLNEKIGGLDIDNHHVPERTCAESEGVTRAHRSGLINDFAHLDTVAILDVRPPEVADLPSHTQFHTWIVRTGLEDAFGRTDNQVAWIVPGWESWTVPPDAAFDAMDAWLSAAEADTSDSPLADKIVAARPATLLDGIHEPDGTTVGGLADYLREYPPFGDAHVVASLGDMTATRIAKPQLKRLDRSDYSGVAFSDAEWIRLKALFPQGVADWTRPGIGQVQSEAWLDYTNGPDGEPLNPPFGR